MQLKPRYSRIVVKVGSSLFSPRGSQIELKYLEEILNQINVLLDSGCELILVSSGAISCGMSLLGLKKRPRDVAALQAAAAIGQNELMGIYRRLLGPRKRLCAQLLLTWEDFEDRGRYLNVRHTLSKLSQEKVLAVINENDTVSTQEIRFGDNDKLSALVATLVRADFLCILSDVEGLYRMPGKEIVSRVDEITPQIARLCSGTDKPGCVGGMSSKLEAIKIAVAAGIPAIITSGRLPDALLKAVCAEEGSVGTYFSAKDKGLKAKKSWLAYGVRPKGALIVDEGAKNALIAGRKSLLSVGILEVEGGFEKGESVSIRDRAGNEFARGRINFSSRELVLQKGSRLKEEVIHRDNLVIL